LICFVALPPALFGTFLLCLYMLFMLPWRP
jgi:hypothetical protein